MQTDPDNSRSSFMQANLLELAKQGDPQAIATLMNQALNTQGISIQATLRQECLHILMESQQQLEPSRIVPALRKAMMDLQSPVIAKVRVYGHHISEASSIWGQVINLRETLDEPLTLRGKALLESLTEDEPPTAIRAVIRRPVVTRSEENHTGGFGYETRSTVLRQNELDEPDDEDSLPDPALAFEPMERDDVCGILQPYPQAKPPQDDRSEFTSLTAAVILNPQKKLRKDQYRLGGVGVLGSVIWGAFLGVLLLGGMQTLQVARSPQDNATPPQTPEASGSAAPSPISSTPSDSRAATSPTPSPFSNNSASSPVSSTLSAIPNQPINLAINTTGKSWVEVIADGKKQYVGVLNPGLQRAWTAQKSLILRVGSAGYVVASFNQTEAKPLGEPGEVVELQYFPTGLKSRQSSRD